MARLHLLRVFCDEHGAGGNPLAVFLEGGQVPASARQAVAADLGLSETVFVDDAERGRLRIFTPHRGAAVRGTSDGRDGLAAGG